LAQTAPTMIVPCACLTAIPTHGGRHAPTRDKWHLVHTTTETSCRTSDTCVCKGDLVRPRMSEALLLDGQHTINATKEPPPLLHTPTGDLITLIPGRGGRCLRNTPGKMPRCSHHQCHSPRDKELPRCCHPFAETTRWPPQNEGGADGGLLGCVSEWVRRILWAATG